MIPPEVRAAMASAGVALATDPETGATSLGLNGFFLARVDHDPPAVVWSEANLGRFLHDLFEYEARARAPRVDPKREILFDPGTGKIVDPSSVEPKLEPLVRTAEAAGCSVWRTGGLLSKETHFAHPALRGEFVRISQLRGFHAPAVAFSSPSTFIPLRMLVELDEEFTPVPYGRGADAVYMSPHKSKVFQAQLKELNRVGQESGFHIRTFEVRKADDHGGMAIRVTVNLTDSPDEGLQSRPTSIRLVLATFGTDPAVTQVLLDFDDDYGQRDGRAILDTTEATSELFEDAALTAYVYAHLRGFHGDLLHLCEAWEREIGYADSQIRKLVQELGAVQVARDLLAQPQLSAAFGRLAEAHRLELAVEFLILRPEWGKLFTFDQRVLAWDRLHDHGMPEEQLPAVYHQYD